MRYETTCAHLLLRTLRLRQHQQHLPGEVIAGAGGPLAAPLQAVPWGTRGAWGTLHAHPWGPRRPLGPAGHAGTARGPRGPHGAGHGLA